MEGVALVEAMHVREREADESEEDGGLNVMAWLTIGMAFAMGLWKRGVAFGGDITWEKWRY